MRIALPLLLSLLVAAGAYAQTPQIDRIDVVEYGIYTSDSQDCSRDNQGVLHCTATNVRLAASTTTIPAQLGVRFGVRFRVAGTPDGASITLKRVWICPPPGLRSPNASQPILRMEDQYPTTIGATRYTEYRFDDPWELVPGTWTLEMWDGNRRLLSQSFTVVRQ